MPPVMIIRQQRSFVPVEYILENGELRSDYKNPIDPTSLTNFGSDRLCEHILSNDIAILRYNFYIAVKQVADQQEADYILVPLDPKVTPYSVNGCQIDEVITLYLKRQDS